MLHHQLEALRKEKTRVVAPCQIDLQGRLDLSQAIQCHGLPQRLPPPLATLTLCLYIVHISP